VKIVTPGGTELTISGREGGAGMDDICLMEQFAEEYPEYEERFDDFYDMPEYQEFQQAQYKSRTEGFGSLVKACPFQFLVGLSYKMTIKLEKQGADFIDGGASTIPAFRR
jgi:hypothetical protein